MLTRVSQQKMVNHRVGMAKFETISQHNSKPNMLFVGLGWV